MAFKFDDRTVAEAHAKRNMTNCKPYRTKALRKLARASAHRCADGAWRSPTGVLYHEPPREGDNEA